MVRVSKAVWAVVSLVAVGLGAGCVDDAGDGALRIIRNQAIEEGEACAISPSLTNPSLSGGTIEASSPYGYLLTPVIQNFATSQGGKYTQQRMAFLEGARVDVSFPDPELFTAAELAALAEDDLLKYSSPFSATIGPDSGTAGVGFEVLPPALLARILPKLATAVGNRTQVHLRIKVFGQMGGGEVESESYFYPVRVCDGCVIASTFTCGATGVTVREGNPCNPYQDGLVDCCVAAGQVYCPGYAGTTLR